MVPAIMREMQQMIRASRDYLGETPREKLQTVLTYIEEQEENERMMQGQTPDVQTPEVVI